MQERKSRSHLVNEYPTARQGGFPMEMRHRRIVRETSEGEPHCHLMHQEDGKGFHIALDRARRGKTPSSSLGRVVAVTAVSFKK